MTSVLPAWGFEEKTLSECTNWEPVWLRTTCYKEEAIAQSTSVCLARTRPCALGSISSTTKTKPSKPFTLVLLYYPSKIKICQSKTDLLSFTSSSQIIPSFTIQYRAIKIYILADCTVFPGPVLSLFLVDGTQKSNSILNSVALVKGFQTYSWVLFFQNLTLCSVITNYFHHYWNADIRYVNSTQWLGPFLHRWPVP